MPMPDLPLRYQPDYAVPPGASLAEALEDQGMTQAELARRTNRPAKTISEIVTGKAMITPETALQFERVLGIPASFWSNLERNYREVLARQAEQRQLEADVGWLKGFPMADLKRLGFVRYDADRVGQLRDLLVFFGVASVEAWNNNYHESLQAHFRKSSAHPVVPGALAAWLRVGELWARQIESAPFDRARFAAALPRLRELMQRPASEYGHRLREECLRCGVVVVYVPCFKGSRASGAACWLTAHRPLILLSDQYRWEDQFCFSFFHEAGHVLLHNKHRKFVDIDGEAQDADAEGEANVFAADALIPRPVIGEFEQRETKSIAAITAFAAQVQVHPGIVVGRLQHDRMLGWDRCNGLRRRLRIVIPETAGRSDSGAAR